MPKVKVEKKQALTGHRDCVYNLEGSASADMFYSAAGDGMVAIWNLDNPESGKLLASVSASVYAIRFLPHYNWLVVGQNYDGIRIIDLDRNKERGSLKLTSSAIFSLAGVKNKLLVGTGNGVIVVVDAEELKIIRQIKASEQSVRAIQVFEDKQEFVAGCSDNTIKVFDLNNFELKQVINAHAKSVFALTYSPDFKYLLSGSRDAHLKIWNAKDAYQSEESIVAHMYAINDVKYSPSGKYFATCSMDKSVKIWDATEFKLLKVIDKVRYAGHGTSVNRLLWLKEETLISCSDDRSISIWNIEINN